MGGADHQPLDVSDEETEFGATLRRRLKALRWGAPSDETRERALEEFERRLEELEERNRVKE